MASAVGPLCDPVLNIAPIAVNARIGAHMDIFQTALTASITSLASAIVGAIVATVISIAKERKRSATDESSSMKDGMRALLWRELKNIHSEAVSNGGMTTEDRRHLEGVYGAYHGIGGNGTGTRLFEESMNMAVLD